jgi:hypothetical protein
MRLRFAVGVWCRCRVRNYGCLGVGEIGDGIVSFQAHRSRRNSGRHRSLQGFVVLRSEAVVTVERSNRGFRILAIPATEIEYTPST